MKIFVIILLVLLLCPATGYTSMTDETQGSHILQNDIISIGGTYRLRGEIDDEFNVRKYGTGTRDDFLLSRLRLEINLKVTKNLRIHTQIQDAEVLESSFSDKDFSGSNNPFHDLFDINQLYIEYWPNEQINGVTAFATYNTIKNLPFQLDLFYVLKYDDRGIQDAKTLDARLQPAGMTAKDFDGSMNVNSILKTPMKLINIPEVLR